LVEWRAGHREREEDTPFARLQLVQAGTEHLLLGKLPEQQVQVPACPDSGRKGDFVTLAGEGECLEDQERGTPGGVLKRLRDPPPPLGVGESAEPCEQLLRLVRGKRFQRELSARRQVGREHVAGPRCGDKEDPRPVEPPCDYLDDLSRGRVEPVKVIEQKHQRVVLGDRGEQLGDCLSPLVEEI
jgi:hypothetical protein